MKVSDTINLKNEIKWVRDIRNLSPDLKEIVQNFLNENDVYQGDCHINSLKLSVFNPKIKRVNGFVGFNFSEIEINFLKSNRKLKKLSNGLYQIELNRGSLVNDCYLDLERGIVYYKHSWNEFEGINFDITIFCQNQMSILKYECDVEEKSKFIKKWGYYFKSSIIDLKKINHRNHSVIDVIKNVIKNYPMEGIIMNRLIYLNDKFFGYHSMIPNTITI